AIGEGHSAAILIAAACVATGVAYVLASRLRVAAPRLSRRTVRVVSVVVLAGVVGGVVASHPAARVRHFTAPPPKPESFNSYIETHLASGTGSGRWQIWTAAFDQFRAHPVVGDGAGSYKAWWLEHGALRYYTTN